MSLWKKTPRKKKIITTIIPTIINFTPKIYTQMSALSESITRSYNKPTVEDVIESHTQAYYGRRHYWESYTTLPRADSNKVNYDNPPLVDLHCLVHWLDHSELEHKSLQCQHQTIDITILSPPPRSSFIIKKLSITIEKHYHKAKHPRQDYLG